MNAMVKYGMFTSALVLAALLGHLVTERSYDLEQDNIHNQVQREASGGTQGAPRSNLGWNSSLERKDSLERIGNLERIDNREQKNSLEPSNSPELSKKAESKNAESKKAIQLDPITAIQAVKLKASQAAAKTPAIQQSELAAKESAEVASKKNAAANQDAAAVDEVASRHTETAGPSDKGNIPADPAFQTSINPDPVGNVLAILSPLLKLDGTPLGLGNIEGKTLLLATWASWCGPCQQQLPNFDELAKKINSPDLAVIVLVLDENLEEARQVLARRQINYPIAILDPGAAEQLQMSAMPTTFIVNSRGRLRVRIVGDLGSPALYEQKLLGVLAETKPNSQKSSTIMKLAGGEVQPQ